MRAPVRSGAAGRTVRLLARRSHRDFRSALTPRQRSALVAYTTFVVTIAGARAISRAVRSGRFGIHNIVIDGIHVHHYVPGIALLTISGAVAVRGGERIRVQCLLGATYGAGCAMVVDELPLLLNLRDVYWAEEGRWAIKVALSVVGVAGAYFSGIPLWRGLREELAGER